jgi:hypothetical protein
VESLSFTEDIIDGDLYKRMEVQCSLKHCHHLKNGFFWDVALCGSCKNRRFGGT